MPNHSASSPLPQQILFLMVTHEQGQGIARFLVALAAGTREALRVVVTGRWGNWARRKAGRQAGRQA